MTRKHLASLIGVALVVTLALVPSGASAGRNASGTYTVNPGAGTWPFVSGTSINSTTMNSIFSDFATGFTDSLSRSGKGGMSAPLQCTDGSASFPSLTFSNETTTGLYRIGLNDVGLSIGGTKRWEHNASGQIETGWLQVAGTLAVGNTVTLSAAGASSYSLTFPPSLASSTWPLSVSSTGQMSLMAGIPVAALNSVPIARTVFNSAGASGTFTTSANTHVLYVRLIGGGGGGGASALASYSAGGGGGAGGYAEKRFVVTPSTGYAYAVGNQGSGGNPGTDTTFTVGAVTVTAGGGAAGTASTGVGVSGVGGAGGSASGGDVNVYGNDGHPGWSTAAIGCAGIGGSSVLGPGGTAACVASAVATAGSAGKFYGAGGGGSTGHAGSSVAGGNGSSGLIIIEEWP